MYALKSRMGDIEFTGDDEPWDVGEGMKRRVGLHLTQTSLYYRDMYFQNMLFVGQWE